MTRRSMTPVPWHGLLRGVLSAVVRPMPARASVPWQAVAQRRRATLIALIALLTGVATLLLLGSPALPAHPLARAVHLVVFALLFAWVSAGFVTALMGAVVLRRGDRHALAPPPGSAPVDAAARTAIIMPICNEDLATVFGGLRATCESLIATGSQQLFDVFVLSDSGDTRVRDAEVRAWRELRETLGPEFGGRLFYRWRARRTRRKAGNVADFCRRWGASYRYMVVLDADSTMSGDALLDLVRTMEAHPRAGIVQTLPRGTGQGTLHARAQQFASRITGRLFALGLAYWQLGDAHYWGHNAILRLQPFMDHCALAPLPGRGGLAGDILSHDFVEAAMMRRAGYEVWLAPHIEGSWEQMPANLLDELQRDRRWCQGNLQNARLLAEPGWLPAHRAMFVTGAMSYAAAPLWLLFVATGLVAPHAATAGWWPAPDSGPLAGGVVAALWVLMFVLLFLPRILGVAAVLLRGEARQYGGAAKLAGSALLEAVLSALQAPVRMLAHSGFVLSALTGWRIDWKSPPRDADRLPWRLALTRLAPSLGGALVLGAAAAAQGPALAWMLPLLLPMLMAAPLAVATGSSALGQRLRAQHMLLIPEERDTPLVLQRAERARPAPVVRLPAAKVQPRWSGRAVARPALSLVGSALMLAVLVPRTLAVPPEPPPVPVELVQRLAAEAAEAEAAEAEAEAALVARRSPSLRKAVARNTDMPRRRAVRG